MIPIDPALRRIIILQFLISGVVGFGLWILGQQSYAASIAAVGIIFSLNWLVLWLSWGLLLFKKSIALGISLIVTKYALFGLIIYWLLGLSWFASSSWVGGSVVLLLALSVEAVVFSGKGTRSGSL